MLTPTEMLAGVVRLWPLEIVVPFTVAAIGTFPDTVYVNGTLVPVALVTERVWADGFDPADELKLSEGTLTFSVPPPPVLLQPVAVEPLTSATTGIWNPLFCALGAFTVTDPEFNPLHKVAGFTVTVKFAGVVVLGEFTVIHEVELVTLMGVELLSLATRLTIFCVWFVVFWNVRLTDPGLGSTTMPEEIVKLTGMLTVPLPAVMLTAPW